MQMRERSAWRLFPWAIAAFMTIVVAVNLGMVWSALHTFPGQAGGDGFDLSNRYDAVLDRVAAQAALGWSVTAEIDAARHAIVLVTDRSHAALAGATLEGTARRPVGASEETRLVFRETGPGRYVAEAALAAKGQWDLLLSVSALGHDAAVTRRIIVR
jgi:nitrogen fixation protein FixH